jgi:hypothetical protein
MKLSPVTSTLWAQWRKSRWVLLATVPGMLLVFAILLLAQRLGASTDIIQIFTFATQLIAIIVGGSTIMLVHSDTERLNVALPIRILRLPVATWKLTAALMIFGLGTMALIATIGTVLVKVILGATYAWWVPAAVAVCAMAALQAWAYGQRENAQESSVASFFISVIVAVFIVTRDTTFILLDRVHPAVSVTAALTFFYVLACAALSINRRDGFADFPLLRRASPAGGGLIAGRLPRFASPMHAQLWYEWRRFGWQLPVGIVSFLIIYFLGMPLLVALFEPSNSTIAQSAMESPGLMAIDYLASTQFVTTGLRVTSMTAALLVGAYMFMKAGYWNAKSTFQLTLPVATPQLAKSRIYGTLKSVAWGFAIVILVFSALGFFMKVIGYGDSYVSFLGQGYRGVPGPIIIAYYLGSILLLMWVALWSVNAGWALLTFCGTMIPVLGILWLLQELGYTSYSTYNPIMVAAVSIGKWFAVPVFFLGFLWAYRQSAKNYLIGRRTTALALALWLTYSTVFISYELRFEPSRSIRGRELPTHYNWENWPHPIDWVLWAALSLLPIAPLFTQALLLHRARHR